MVDVVDPFEDVVVAPVVEAPVAVTPHRGARPAPPLGEYVALQVGITRAQLGVVVARNAVLDPEGRLARTERYARWRWQGFVDGQISSL